MKGGTIVEIDMPRLDAPLLRNEVVTAHLSDGSTVELPFHRRWLKNVLDEVAAACKALPPGAAMPIVLHHLYGRYDKVATVRLHKGRVYAAPSALLLTLLSALQIDGEEGPLQ